MTGHDNHKHEYSARETEVWYKDLVDHACDLIQCVDSEGRFIFVNQAWLSTLNYTAEDIANTTLWDIIHPDSMEHCKAVFEKALNGKAFTEFEATFTTKDGAPVFVEGNVSVKLDEKGLFEHIRVIFRNVTERKLAEEILRESEERFRFLSENMGDAAWTMDMDLNTTYISPSSAKVFGFTQSERLQQKFDQIMPPHSLATIMQSFQEEVLKAQKSKSDQDRHITVEAEFYHKNGGTVWVENQVKLIRDVSGEITGIYGSSRDITERKTAEEELLGLKKFNERIVQNINEGIIISDKDGLVTFANEALLNMLGYKIDEFIGTHWTFIVPADQHSIVADADKRRNHGLVDRYELTLKHKNGSLIPVQVSGSPYYDHKTGLISGTLAALSDVSELKKAQELIITNEERLRLMTRNIQDVVLETDTNGYYTYVSESSESVIGYNKNELLGKRAFDFLHPDDAERVAMTIVSTFGNSKVVRMEYRYNHKTRGYIWVEGVGRAYQNSNNENMVLITVRDITERKQAEVALLAEQSEKALILNNLAEQVAFIDPEMRIIWANSKVIERHNLHNIDFRGQKCYEIYHQLEKPCPDCPIIIALNTGETVSGIHKSPDNHYWQITGVPVHDQSGNLIGVMDTALEITDLVESKEALKKSEAKYRSLTGKMSDILWTIDLYLNITYVSPSVEKVLGFTIEERMQQPLEEQMPPEALQQALDKLAEELAVDDERDPERYVTLELDYYHKDGSIRCLETTLSALRDDSGKPVGILGMSRDITERKQAEESLRQRLQYEQLLAEISSIAVNIENLERFLEKCLSILGQELSLSRVYIFEHNHDIDTMDNTHEWCAEGIEPQKQKLQGIPVEAVPWWFKTLSRGDLICFSDIRDIPDPGAREMLSSQGIFSIMVVPLYLDGKYRGFIGFDDCFNNREWHDEDAAILSAICRIIDSVNQRCQVEEKIRYLSYHDQLTGLYNRHFLEEEMKRFDTERQLPISIIMADLNGLKLVNDTIGHLSGDEMLKKAAEILRTVCREDDLLARFGGDEFVLYLPRTPQNEAQKICGRIEKACCKEQINGVPLSLATGVAVKLSAEQKLSDLLKVAEDNMYRDKLTESRSGKSAIVKSLLQTLAAKSFETEAHTRNMQEAAKSIGEKLGLPHSELHRLSLLITLHDIGKINIPEELLTKKGPLNAAEWEIMKKHSETGYRIAKATDNFAHVAEDILAHHERWNGSGYPQGLKREAIPLLARITAIADAYEVMSNGRPYKKAMNRNYIVAELKNCSGTQFDPELVEIFLSILETDG